MSDGTEQRERFPAALEEGYFHVDETPFEHLVEMSAGLAARLRFVDLNLREEGTWRDMFASDESLVLARIASVDRRALQSAFLRQADSAPPAQLAHEVVRLAHWIDLWFKSLAANRQPASQALRQRIAQLVTHQLADELDWVHRHFGAQQVEGRALAHSSRRLDPIWTARRPSPPHATHRSDRERLRDAYFSLLGAIARVQSLARELLPQTLATAAHEPALGLLMAFLQLYGSVQQQINRFTGRHIDFYYRDCLGLRPQPPQPDSAYLCLRRDTRTLRDVVLPRGTTFAAGKDAAGRAVEFRADDGLLLTDARVAALCTLRLERDALISPERELGYVTRAKATRIEAAGAAPAGAAVADWPLFGGSAPAAEDARIGLAIATPLLLLKEGEREIRVTLRIAPDPGPDALAVESVLQAPTRAAFFAALGRLFRVWLFADADMLGDAELQRLRDAARRLLGDELPGTVVAGHPLCLVCGTQRPARELIFDQVLNGVFDLALSTAGGWLDAPQAHTRRAPAASGTPGGLQIVIRLRAEDPPIVACDPAVHGAHWPTRLPLLRLQLSTRGRLYGYSLFDGLELAEAALAVKVAGVRDLVLHNNLGRLDAAKAFNPFGPLPTLSSYLVFGAPEIARKNVQALSLQIEWGGLPAGLGGFDSWYRGYGREFGNDAFTGALAILRDGQWRACGGSSAQQPLFAGLDAAGRLRPVMRIDVDAASVRKHGRAASGDSPLDPNARNGLYRLQLSGPPGAFGHTMYPVLLAEAVTLNAKRKRPLPLPNAPYTPLIERLTLDYEASSTIRLAGNGQGEPGADTDAERLLQLHPFGIAELHGTAAGAGPGLLPCIDHDGNLYIGIAAGALQGALTLLFHLRDEAAAEPLGNRAPPAIAWSVLVSDRWQPLPPSRVLSDGTGGFLSSGIVTLDLPAGLDSHSTLLPAGLYWLRASADSGLDGVAGLHGVQAHGLRVTRVLGEAADGRRATAAPLPAAAFVQPAVSVVGLAGVSQLGPSFGLRDAEDARRFRTRVGERLRHKDRASLAWDTERLVLERFPEVGKVQCFAAQEFGGAAGEVLVVVVPAVPRNDAQHSTLAPRLNAIALQRITRFLSARASPFARIRVRNAAYERLQVRCGVQLQRGVQPGVALRGINEAIVEYLSPWHDRGYAPRFGWTARCDDIEARLRELGDVAAVAGLSLLQVACSDDGVYTLGDTARMHDAATPSDAAATIHARTPWSIALPMREHMVSVAADLAEATPEATGIARLAVGSTFIVGRGAP